MYVAIAAESQSEINQISVPIASWLAGTTYRPAKLNIQAQEQIWLQRHKAQKHKEWIKESFMRGVICGLERYNMSGD